MSSVGDSKHPVHRFATIEVLLWTCVVFGIQNSDHLVVFLFGMMIVDATTSAVTTASARSRASSAAGITNTGIVTTPGCTSDLLKVRLADVIFRSAYGLRGGDHRDPRVCDV
jgi:hypothetical protein